MDGGRIKNSKKYTGHKKFEKGNKWIDKCGGVIFTSPRPDIRMLRPRRPRRRRYRKQEDNSEKIVDVKNF
jgi:hypothetical protein